MNQVNWQRRRDILICVICLGIIIWTIWGLVNQFVEAIFLFLLAMAIAFLKVSEARIYMWIQSFWQQARSRPVTQRELLRMV